jgi:hypothetical protein
LTRPQAPPAPSVTKYPVDAGLNGIPQALMKDVVKTPAKFVDVSEATYEQRQEETVKRLEQFLKGSP